MPIERSSLQFKMWILLLIVSAILVFVALKALEKNASDSFSENKVLEGSSEGQEGYLSFESNETLEESLFNEFETQKSLFFLLVGAISLAFVAGFILKFLQDRKKEK